MIMEAKELMIGDIIQAVVFATDDDDNEVTYKVPARVEAIDENGMLGIDGKDSILVEYIKESEMDCYERFDDIEPIPLTEEILLKNGFEFFDCSYFNDIVSITFLPSCIYFICHVYKGEVCDVIERHINYVHELQHLLHLCELADMANNFKIE